MVDVLDHEVYHLLSQDYTKRCHEKISRHDLELAGIGFEGKIAFVLNNVLLPAECETLIKETEAVGYIPALNHDMTMIDQRHSDCVIMDDKKFADIIFHRIEKHLPQAFQVDGDTLHQLLSINGRLRFLRYDVGGKFGAHDDEAYEREDSARAWITLQICLNEDGVVGGETTFLKKDATEEECQMEENRVPIKPTTGSMLIFQNDIFHEGSEVKGGPKYSLRMDVLFEDDRGAAADFEPRPPKNANKLNK